MDGNLASIYSLIHAFLSKHSHTKAAQAVKKAAREIVILKDDIDLEGPQLDEIIAQWKLLKASSQKASVDSSSSESDSDSSKSSSSSSSSSSSPPSNPQIKKVKAKGTPKKASPSSEESESGSSESDSDSDSKKSIKAAPVLQTKTKVPVPLVKSDSYDDESSDSESSEQMEKNVDKKVKLNTDKKPKVERESSRTLSSENTSSSNEKESLISSKRESSASTDPSSEVGTPKAEVEPVQVTKKRRTDRDGTAVTTSTTLTVRQEEIGPKSTGRIKGNAKFGRQVNERFRRVDPTKMEPIADNRYVAKIAPTNDYGQRAHEDLIITRGQGFRKEKNKKKKGSYRGGEITMESHSFKFA